MKPAAKRRRRPVKAGRRGPAGTGLPGTARSVVRSAGHRAKRGPARRRARPPGAGIAAVRGAIDVPANTATDIRERTARLLAALVERNGLEPARILSALFTTTADLDADFPAHAARRLGWTDVPMLNAREIPVPGSMPRVVRVLLLVGGVAAGARLEPAYLDGAAALRPDLAARAAVRGAPARARARPRPKRRLALIGLGQIGGSIGLALAPRAERVPRAASGFWRAGFDLDREMLDAARAAGAIDEIAPSLEAACAGAELAVLATPVDALPALIEAAAAALPAGAVLMDTGSARAGVTPALERAAARGIRALGGHPIAGTEARGFAAARGDLFDGAPFVLCRIGDAVPDLVLELVHDLGARAIEVDPAAHDRGLARTSHLPYLVACALQEIGEPFARVGLSGPAFRDMTRVAASDPAVAGAYCRANADQVEAAWSELRAALERRLAELEAR